MNDIEYYNVANDSPFIAIAIGSFDLLSGIRLSHAWVFQKDENIEENLENTLKLTLASVHRQNEKYYANGSTSIIDYQIFKWFITNTIFFIPSSTNSSNQPMKRNKFISIIFIFKSILIRNDLHLRNSLLLLTKKFAQNVKSLITDNKPFTFLKECVNNIVYRGSCLIQSGIPPSYILLNKEFKLPSSDFLFYTTLLTSHIQTKMATVIETSSLSDALQIVSFLINFMLPFQTGQSSIQHMLKPAPGLFLQIVEKQNQPINDIIKNFSGPVTWLRLFERRKIFQFVPAQKPKSNSNTSQPLLEIIEIFTENPDKDVKPLASNWSLATCQLLLNSQSKTESKVICEQQFSELTRQAIVFLVAESKKGEKEMLKKLMDVSDQDERMLNSVAQLLQMGNATD